MFSIHLFQKTTNVESKYLEEEQSLEPRTEWSALSFILFILIPLFSIIPFFPHPVSTQKICLELWK